MVELSTQAVRIGVATSNGYVMFDVRDVKPNQAQVGTIQNSLNKQS